MNATDRIAAKGLDFKVGQTVSIETPWSEPIRHTIADGEWVVLDAATLEIYDIADNRETAESMAYERDSEGTTSGYVAVHVTTDGMTVEQHWRDVVADCWGLEN